MALGADENESAYDNDETRPEEVVEDVHPGIELFQDGVVECLGVVVTPEGGVAVSRYRVGEFVHDTGVLRP